LCEAAQRLVDAAHRRCADAASEHPFVQRGFEPDALESLARLRDAIAARGCGRWRRHLRWALLGTLRDVASVKVGWPYQRPGVDRDAPYHDPAARFLSRAEMIAEDIELASGKRPSGRVVRGDARSASSSRRVGGGQDFDA